MASRPTKYAHVTAGLPKLNTLEPERKAIVTAVMAEITEPSEPLLTNREVLDTLSQIDSNVRLLIKHLKTAAGGRRYAAKLAEGYADARVFMDEVGGWKSSLQVVIDAYELLMLEQMEVEAVASMRLESGASVSTYVEPYGQVVDKEKFRLWCIANGYEAQLQLWPSTMNSITKERLLEGEAPPDGVEAFAKTMVRLNKA